MLIVKVSLSPTHIVEVVLSTLKLSTLPKVLRIWKVTLLSTTSPYTMLIVISTSPAFLKATLPLSTLAIFSSLEVNVTLFLTKVSSALKVYFISQHLSAVTILSSFNVILAGLFTNTVIFLDHSLLVMAMVASPP